MSSSAPLVSASLSDAVRFLPFADLGFSSPSAFSAAGAFLALGLAGTFLDATSVLGRSLMRVERRGSALSVAALRGIDDYVDDGEKKRGGMGTQDG